MYGLATHQEFFASECQITLDLDEDDSTVSGNGYIGHTCANSPTGITDTDLVLQSQYIIDSIAIEFVVPPLDGPNEHLSGTPSAAVSIQGNNTHKVLLINNGSATDSDFAGLLQTIRYQNDSPSPQMGWRQISLNLYAGGADTFVSADIEILLHELPVFSLGADTTLCPSTTLSLFTGLLNSYTDETLVWQNGSQNDTFLVQSPGVYWAELTTTFGCAWSDTIAVSYGDTAFAQESIILCEGETFFLNNQPFIFDTLICITYIGFNGCDSTHCTSLTFLPTYLTTLDSSICEGSSVTVGTSVYSSSGTYLDTLISANQCDSVLQLELTVLKNDTTYIEDEICEGESYEVNGLYFSSQGIFDVLSTNQTGCDSIIILHLNIKSATIDTIDVSICQGETFEFSGQMLTLTGIYYDTLQTISGCDSIMILNLTAFALPDVTILSETDNCNGAATLSAQADVDSFLWSNGEQSATINVSFSGIYSVTATSVNGCSDFSSIEIEVVQPITATIESKSPSCHNTFDGYIEILDINGGTSPYSFSLDNGTFSETPLFDGIPGGTYTIYIQDNAGCKWENTAILELPLPFMIDAGQDLVITSGESILLNASASHFSDSAWWIPPAFIACDSCLQSLVSPPYSITYQIFALNENGCLASDEIYIHVNDQHLFFAPNAFSPNNDGFNDYFTIFSNDEIYQIEKLEVFDRWGGMVFQGNNLSPNAEPQGWDGNWRGKKAAQGVYAWVARLRLVSESIVLAKGEITLLR